MAIVLSILWALVIIVVIGGLIYLCFYVYNKISGDPVPAKLQQVVWLVFLLICLIILVTKLWPIVAQYSH